MTQHPRVAVYLPGKVPVFVKREDLAVGGIFDVVLRADEIVVQFWLQLPPNTPVRLLDSSLSRNWEMRDRSILPDGIDYREAVRQMEWRSAQWGYSLGARDHKNYKNTLLLEKAVGATIDERDGMNYDRWYANQWKYDDQTGNWQVVIPQKGRFIITINEESRDVGSGHREHLMYPGLYLDATDTANPKVDLLYAP